MGSTSAGDPSSLMKEFPNWVEMPQDLMANILERLGVVEILNSARKVCTTWRRICKDPAMWKVIVMWKKSGSRDKGDADYVLETLTKQAVDLSCGELIHISIYDFGTDDLLDHIALRSTKLKRLWLFGSDHMTGSGLSRAVKRFPLLADLRLMSIFLDVQDIEVIGQNCPQLKSFTILLTFDLESNIKCDDHAVAIANNMPNLRYMVIHGDEMTNDGFQAILNGCPHLQSLVLHMRIRFFLDINLVKQCMKRIRYFKHNSTHEDTTIDDSNFSGSDADEFSQGED